MKTKKQKQPWKRTEEGAQWIVLLILFLFISSLAAFGNSLGKSSSLPPPAISCSGNVTVYVDPGSCQGTVTVPVPVHSGVSITNDYNGTSNASGIYKIGTTFVTWTSTDAFGNTANCSQRIIVLDDVDPTFTCAPDQSGNAAPGSCNAPITVTPPTFDSENCLGTALYLNGTSQYFTHTAQTVPFADNFTVELWVKPDPGTNITYPYGVYALAAGGQRFVISPENGSLIYGTGHAIMALSVGSNGVRVYEHTHHHAFAVAEANMPISTTAWTHVAVSYVSRRAHLYINGTLIQVGVVCPWIIHPGHQIFGAGPGYGQKYKGALDEFRYWNYAKTQSQIQADMHKEMVGNESGLHTQLNFNEGSGSRAFSNNLTPYPLTGSPTWITPDGVRDYTIINDFNNTSNASGTYPTGATTVTWTITDKFGNANTCAQVITVNDTQVPTITCSNASAAATPGTCSGNVTVPAPVVSDNCAVTSIVNSFNGTSNASGVYPVGTTNVLWTIRDAAGNTATCTSVVTVSDIPPAITANDVTVSADPGACGALVSIPVSTTDNCPGTIALDNSFNHTPDPSGFYPVGTTVVTITATDLNGNVSTKTVHVTVEDNQDPVINCPADITVSSATGCNIAVSVPAPVVSDNCAGINIVNDFNHTADASGTYPLGVTTVNWTITDGAGNTSTCSMTVTVNTTALPSITCPADIVVSNTLNQCYANVSVPSLVASSACGSIASITNDFNGTSNASGQYPIGTTIVRWTVTDVNGTTNGCTMTVTVNDTQLPQIAPITNVVLPADANACTANVTLPAPAVSDNCTGVTIRNDFNNTADASGVYPVGTTTVTWTAVDASGNQSTRSILVTVQDTQAPIVTTPATQTVSTAGSCSATVSLFAPGASDNCGIAKIYNDYSGTNPTAVFPVGTKVITWTVEDTAGNKSTVTQEIIVEDTEAPKLNNVADIGSCEAFVTIPVPNAVDNCGIDHFSNDYTGTNNASGTYPDGSTLVTWTVRDIHGNVTTIPMIVTVNLNPEVADAGNDQITCTSPVALEAQPISSGTGEWKVIEGSGTFSDKRDPLATVTGLSSGVNKFEWKVQVTGCAFADTVVIDFREISVTAQAGSEYLEFGETTNLVASASGTGTFEWTPNESLSTPSSEQTTARPLATTTYMVTFKDDVTGCEVSDDITITVKPGLFITTGVTPNGDSFNDTWQILGLENFPKIDVQIYNRNGDLVYEAPAYNNNEVVFRGEGNRGIYPLGRELPSGTYFYIINKNDGSKGETGYLELIR